jgi:hypothetical protein
VAQINIILKKKCDRKMAISRRFTGRDQYPARSKGAKIGSVDRFPYTDEPLRTFQIILTANLVSFNFGLGDVYKKNCNFCNWLVKKPSGMI